MSFGGQDDKNRVLRSLWSHEPISNPARRFPAGSHNETWACSDYYQTISYFLDEVTCCTSAPAALQLCTSAPSAFQLCTYNSAPVTLQLCTCTCEPLHLQVLYLSRESGRPRPESPATLVTHSNVHDVWNCSSNFWHVTSLVKTSVNAVSAL